MYTPTIIKQLQTASAFILCLLFLVFVVQPVWAQSEGEEPPAEEGYEKTSSGTTSEEDPPAEEGYERVFPVSSPSNATNGEEDPPAEEGYDRWSEGNPSALTAGTLAEQPAKLALLGNYPNPFNPETTIRFAIQEGQHVRLAVFNLMGQRVQMLVDGYMEAGQHEARFMAHDLPSGTYFTRLETQTGIAIQKMVLAK